MKPEVRQCKVVNHGEALAVEVAVWQVEFSHSIPLKDRFCSNSFDQINFFSSFLFIFNSWGDSLGVFMPFALVTVCVSSSSPGPWHRRAAHHEGHRAVLQAVWGRADAGAPGAPPAGGPVQTTGAAAHRHEQPAALPADDAAPNHQGRRRGEGLLKGTIGVTRGGNVEGSRSGFMLRF